MPAMPLHQHLHLLIPSSGVSIESRIYLPHVAQKSLGHALSTSPRSEPIRLEDLTAPQRRALQDLKLARLVTAAHPWGRLGGNMLFPVISIHLPQAVCGDNSDAAVATFNVRGVGRSGGSMPWPGCGIGHDANDFAAVEQAMLDLMGGEPDIYRLGYSYGTNLALNAALPPRGVKRTMLVSPAPTLFKLMTLMAGPTFASGLNAALDRAAEARARGDSRTLWVVYGTSDDFTGVSTLSALGGERHEDIVFVEIEGCGHFYVRDEDGVALRRAIAEWISGK